MDPTVLAVVVASVLAGAGGFFVPALIGRIPPHVPVETIEDPTPAESEIDGTVDATAMVVTTEPPEPYADIARLPGLGWKSAVAAAVAGAIVGVYAGFLLGGVLGGLLSVLRVVERKGFPFGPFMLLGALVGLLWGESLWSALVSG